MNIKNELKKLYGQSSAHKAFFEDLAARRKQYAETSVERAETITKGSRTDVVALFKALENLGAGDFIVGRKGSASRIRWKLNMSEIGQAAIGELETPIDPVVESEVESEDMPAIEEMDGLAEHPFRLRKGLVVYFRLPEDLSADEARRLGAFIQSLPL